jgi:hypothetical protein
VRDHGPSSTPVSAGRISRVNARPAPPFRARAASFQGGKFYWRQFVTAADLGVDAVYVAMFDEVDEGTAIFKVSNKPPTLARFETYHGLPSDWYLRLTCEGAKVIRGKRKSQRALPIRP